MIIANILLTLGVHLDVVAKLMEQCKYTCFCPHCLRDTQCHGNVEKLNQKFYKYCVVEDDIKKLIFRGSSRFSNCRETKAPIFFIPRLKFIAGNH